MLSREHLQSGSFLDNLRALPPHVRWTRERMDESMRATLRQRPPHGGVWLFGYGSLIWNPIIRHVDRQVAVLDGWHRSFCMRLLAGRASISAPGRMLGLRPGGQTAGMAFRLSEEDLEEELTLVWTREMPTGAYSPLWRPIVLKDGTPQVALVFVSSEEHPFLETDTSIATIAPLMAAASGPIGTNADYVLRLAATIEELGFEDAYVKALAGELDRLRASRVRTPG